MKNKPSITDDMLVAYLDGEVDDATKAYIDDHQDAFGAQLAALRSADSDLRQQLAALKPPSTFELGQYHLGLGSSAERSRIAAYLAQHPHAAKSVDILDAFLTELDPGPIQTERVGILTQARIMVARLLGDGTAHGGLAMGLRGAQEGIYQAGDFQIVVETDTDFDDPAKLALTGLLTGHDETKGLSANLWQADQVRHIATVPIDAFGNFGFGLLESGQYELIISADDAEFEIHIQNIAV